jgi:hypothetical protein
VKGCGQNRSALHPLSAPRPKLAPLAHRKEAFPIRANTLRATLPVQKQSVKTEFGAKTMGLDTKTHNIFVDTVDFGSPASSGRPGAAVPGTFHVLVYAR